MNGKLIGDPVQCYAQHGGYRKGKMRRWLYSTKAKDIGTLYIIFAIIGGLKGGRRYNSSIISDRLLGGVGKVKYMVVTVLLGVLGVFIIYLLLINKIGIDVRTSLILSIMGIGIYMIWLLGTEGGKRWMERVGKGFYSSSVYDIMRDPEGDLLPKRYEYLRVSLMNKGFLWLLISYVVLRNIMKNMSLTGLDEGLMRWILVLGNIVSMVYMLMMLFKTGVMGREYVMKVIRGIM